MINAKNEIYLKFLFITKKKNRCLLENFAKEMPKAR